MKPVWSPKHCIFCGEKPERKTKEHFVPRWLSKASGNDEEPALFDTRKGVQRIKFSSITAPACEECNGEMSALEARVKNVFLNLREGLLESSDIPDLLDWLDKFRVSSWLYMLSAWKDRHEINPRFSVKSRIGKSDRLASISLLPDPNSIGVGLVGNTSDFFVSSPTVIGLLFRDVAILSWSEVSALGDKFGYTKTTMGSVEDGHPVLNKARTEASSIPPHLDINILPSTDVFTFAAETADFHPEIPTNNPMILDGNGNISPAPTRLEIPRSKIDKWVARDLFAQSVFEQQKKSSHIYSFIPTTLPQKQEFWRQQRELDTFIDSAVSNANERSLIRYSRRVPNNLF